MLTPVRASGTGFTVTSANNLTGALRHLGLIDLPAQLAGRDRQPVLPGYEAIGVYGGGLATFVVLAVRGSAAQNLVPDALSAGGTPLDIAGGAGAGISAPLINAIVVRPPGWFWTFLLAGPVSAQLLERAATDLTELVTGS